MLFSTLRLKTPVAVISRALSPDTLMVMMFVCRDSKVWITAQERVGAVLCSLSAKLRRILLD